MRAQRPSGPTSCCKQLVGAAAEQQCHCVAVIVLQLLAALLVLLVVKTLLSVLIGLLLVKMVQIVRKTLFVRVGLTFGVKRCFQPFSG